MSGSNTFLNRYGNLLEAKRQRDAQRAEELRLEEEIRQEEETARRRQIEESTAKRERERQILSLVEEDGKLREYQQLAVKNIIEAWRSKCRNVILQMPTGTGKTRLFVALTNVLTATEAANFGIEGHPRFLIVTHREELVEQISETLASHYNLSHKIVGKGTRIADDSSTSNANDFITTSNFTNSTNCIFVSSIQYLSRRLKPSEECGVRSEELQRFDFIIIDEAHHSLAESYRMLWKAYPNAYKLGVTATPYRMKGDGFTSLYDKLIVSQGMSEFIEQGYLADYRLFTVSRSQAALQKVNRLKKVNVGGDYQVKDLQEIYANNEEIAFLYDCYERYARGKKGIIYAVNQLHAEMIASYFAERGVSIANIDSKTTNVRRKELIAQFRNGELQLLVNVELFGEGFDCPAIEFAMLARPTKSLAMYLQQVGRALRPMPSANEELRVKNEELRKVVILDCVGLYNRFGSPEDMRDWEYYFKREKRTRGGDYPEPLGIDEDVDGMVEVSTPRKMAEKKAEEDRKRMELDVFRGANDRFGIRNGLGEDVTKPVCDMMRKTADGWFYGKDRGGYLVVYDMAGNLVFKRNRCRIEINADSTFFIVVTTADGAEIGIGPFDKRMFIKGKNIETKRVWYSLNESRTDVFQDSHNRTLYVQRKGGVVMTDFKLRLETRFFRKLVRTREGQPLLVDFDNKIYTFTYNDLMPSKRFSQEEATKIVRSGIYWDSIV